MLTEGKEGGIEERVEGARVKYSGSRQQATGKNPNDQAQISNEAKMTKLKCQI